MFYNALDSFAEREIGMKKIYLLLFLCTCITSCVRVNENDMKQISNSTQGTQTNKDVNAPKQGVVTQFPF